MFISFLSKFPGTFSDFSGGGAVDLYLDRLVDRFYYFGDTNNKIDGFCNQFFHAILALPSLP